MINVKQGIEARPEPSEMMRRLWCERQNIW